MDETTKKRPGAKMLMIIPLATGAMWGTTGIFVRSLDAFNFDNFSMVFLRFSLAALMLLVYLLFSDKSLLKFKLKDFWLLSATAVVGILMCNYFYNGAAIECTLSLAHVLVSTCPAFVLPISAALFKEKVTIKKIICLISMFMGCTLVTGILNEANLLFTPMGLLFGILCAITYALYAIFSRMAIDRGYDALTVTFYSMAITAVLLIPFNDWTLTVAYIEDAPFAHGINLFLQGLIPSALPYLTYAISLQYIDPAKVTMICTGTEPTFAMLCGIFLYSEIPSALILLGLVIVVFSLAMLAKLDSPN